MFSKQILPLLFGVLLGLSVSTIFFYPTEFSNIFIFNDRKTANNLTVNNQLVNFYNESLADELYRNVRILCWILTTPENHKTKAIHIKNTWGKRCNKLLFMSSTIDVELGTVALPVQKEGRATLWDKTRFALQYLYNYHFDDADWFLKGDDDSFFVLENLRYMLSQYPPQTSFYLGHRFASKYTKSGYMAGGGYVLSKKAVEKFVTKLMHNEEVCKLSEEGAEDLELGKCLENSTIFIDERDELKQKRFFPVGVNEHLNEQNENVSYWYDQMLYYDVKYGSLECCSDTFVNSHYITPRQQYMLNYLIYNVHPFGLQKNVSETLPPKLTFDEILKASDVASNASDFQSHAIFHDLESSEKFKR